MYSFRLIAKDNDYEREQAAAAERAAAKLGIAVEIIYAGNDAIVQSQQLLEAIQADPERRPHAIVLTPAGTLRYTRLRWRQPRQISAGWC